MSDTIAVMNAGEIQQIGSPEDIYNEPKNAFVANFIGESNILGGVMREDFRVDFAGASFECVDKGFRKDEEVDVVIRPEDVRIVERGRGQLAGVVRNATFKGVHYEMLIEMKNEMKNSEMDFIWKIHSTVLSEKDSEVGMVIDPDLIHVMRKTAQ